MSRIIGAETICKIFGGLLKPLFERSFVVIRVRNRAYGVEHGLAGGDRPWIWKDWRLRQLWLHGGRYSLSVSSDVLCGGHGRRDCLLCWLA